MREISTPLAKLVYRFGVAWILIIAAGCGGGGGGGGAPSSESADLRHAGAP